MLSAFLREKCSASETHSPQCIIQTNIHPNSTKVLYISDECCTELNIYYFNIISILIINDSIFNLMMLIESGILLKNHVSCNLC